MRKYLELFTNGFDETITDKVKVENKPYIAYSTKEGRVTYTVVPKPADPNTYVTFKAEEDGSSIGLESLSSYQTLEYSTDATTWSNMDTSTTITLANVGDEVYIRGMLSDNNSLSNFTEFKMTGKIAASGNCNAIWNYQDLNAPLKAFCGYYMFYNCTSLTAAPELLATTLANRCYGSMFRDCKSLTTAPELPATTLTNSCYNGMFSNCTSLTIAPELPATTLAEKCYQEMFYNCTSLTTAPELPATILAEYCYGGMFFGCSSLTTTPELPATILADSCYNAMFRNCTSLTAAPELPATTLAKKCYYFMFFGCSSLTTAPELPATTLADSCYERMFFNCTSLTTAPELPAMTLARSCYNMIFSDCTSLNYIKCLATDVSVSGCTSDWVNNVSSTGTFVKHPGMSKWPRGVHGIPEGWTVIDAEL